VSEKFLTVEGLEVGYGTATALRGVSLTVARGEFLTVLGANGAGKSTLARALSGLVAPRAGAIHLGGQEITGWTAHRVRRAGLVYLPEGRGILPGLNVLENLRMAVLLLPRAERRDAIEHAFTLFPVLKERRRQRAGSLSGGEQQMVSLARGLAVPPKVIIADELSLGLAPRVVDTVFESLAGAKSLGVTMILIEQFVHRALSISDSCVILRRGRLVWSGPASGAAEQAFAQYIGQETTDLAPDPISSTPEGQG
jgi:branched-chain amino acid transport system ATP-binding protein